LPSGFIVLPTITSSRHASGKVAAPDSFHGVFGRFDLAALRGCQTLNVCFFEQAQALHDNLAFLSSFMYLLRVCFSLGIGECDCIR
jgi:hypothetical protein